MKPYLIILCLILTLSIQAQNWKRGLTVVGYHVGTIALGAIADAQYDEGNKNLSHALHAAEVGALISGPFVFKVSKSEAFHYIGSYVFLRFSFFDSFYNVTRNLPVLYNGTTSGYDRFMNTMPDDGKAWWKSMSLIVGVAFPLNHLRDG